MGIQNSYLSKPGLGYDTVLAVNPTALNAIMKKYYANANAAKKFNPPADPTQPEQLLTFYYYINSAGEGAPIDRETLLSTVTNGIDPLTVASTDSETIAELNATSFYFAFSFLPGDPGTVESWECNYLTFKPGTQEVVYTLCCTDLQIVFFDETFGRWINIKQSDGSTLFNISSTITLQNIVSNNNLTTDVQQELTDLGNQGLSVYQLLFDFDTAVVDPSTSIPGIANVCGMYPVFTQEFVRQYLNVFNKVVAPVLNYSVVQPNSATLVPTSMNFDYEQAVDANGNPVTTLPSQNTLNYFFATGGKTLPAPAQIDWNWLDTADINNGLQGAMAINRNSLAAFFHEQLQDYVSKNCFTPTLQVNSFPLSPEYAVIVEPASYEDGGGVQPLNLVALGQQEDTLLAYQCYGNSTATGWGTTDTMHVNASYLFELNVDMPGVNPLVQTLILTQTVWFYIDATGNKNVGSQQGGNPPYQGYAIRKTYTDKFSVIIDSSGNVNLTNVSAQVSDTSDTNLPVYIQETLKSFNSWDTACNLKQIPISMPKQFVFPGGTTFTFSNAGFSQYSDLVCNVRYNNIV